MTVKKPLFLILIVLSMSSSFGFSIIDTKNNPYNINSTSLNISDTIDSVDYLIITTENFKPYLEPLAKWKTQKGLVAKIELIENIRQQYTGRNRAEKIKNCIIDYNNNYNTQWILLAGDVDHVPSRDVLALDGFSLDGNTVSCDSYYTDLNNNWDLNNDGNWGASGDELDFEPEVYVGRLPADNEVQMQQLVHRILAYEKRPTIGPWMSHALFAGAILQFDQDWNNDSFLDYGECDGNRVNNFIKTLLPDNWTSTFLAQTKGVKGTSYYNDSCLNYNTLKNYIDEGCSIGTIFAHGSPTGMAIDKWLVDYDGDFLFDYIDCSFEGGTPVDVMQRDILFDMSYMDFEPEDNKTGIFYFGSCSTGTFDHPTECLAQKFLRKAAIGVIAASQVAWGEDQWYERNHGGWFIEGLGFRFYEQLFLYNQPGKALALAKADYVSDRINSSEPKEYPEWGNKTLKQYNLLGDPEVPIWLSIPKQLNISINQPPNDDENLLTLLVTAEGAPVQNAIITYTKENNLFWKGITNENGTIDIPLSKAELNGKILTVSKIGYLPYQESIPQIASESIPGYDVVITFTILLSLIFIYISSDNRKRLNKKRV